MAADAKEDFALTIVRSGMLHAEQQGRELDAGPGDAVLTTDADRAALSFPATAQSIVLQPSRKALSALVPNVDDAVARPIPRDSEALRLLVGYATMLQAGGGLMAPQVRHAAATHLLDLVALTVGAGRDAAAQAEGRGLRGARLAAVKADVATNLTRPDLSVSMIAARHRITPRYLARLFESQGTTFSDYVRNQRLERARRLLVDPRWAGRSISEIAYDAGFGDLSYFNRCFRRSYGATPGEIREQSRRTWKD